MSTKEKSDFPKFYSLSRAEKLCNAISQWQTEYEKKTGSFSKDIDWNAVVEILSAPASMSSRLMGQKRKNNEDVDVDPIGIKEWHSIWKFVAYNKNTDGCNENDNDDDSLSDEEDMCLQPATSLRRLSRPPSEKLREKYDMENKEEDECIQKWHDLLKVGKTLQTEVSVMHAQRAPHVPRETSTQIITNSRTFQDYKNPTATPSTEHVNTDKNASYFSPTQYTLGPEVYLPTPSGLELRFPWRGSKEQRASQLLSIRQAQHRKQVAERTANAKSVDTKKYKQSGVKQEVNVVDKN